MKLVKSLTLCGFGLALLVLSGCKTPKDIAYFQEADVAALYQAAADLPITIKPDDKLSIIVKCKDPEIANLFNLPVYSVRVGNQQGTTADAMVRKMNVSGNEGVAVYTVTPSGDIDFPVLGKLHIEGMTRSEVAGFIKGELMGRDLVKDPTVSVEFLSAGVNVLGAVKRPGRFEINKDHVTLLEALSLAGDLEITGQRDNIRVLRREDGGVRVYQVNITNMDSLVKSPAYYLQQEDVVYVEPNSMAKRQSTVNGNNALSTSFWVSVASLITSAVTTVGVFVNK